MWQEVGEIRNDSPTCTKESIHVALSVIVSKQWKCQSLDVKAAFLQGKTADRDVFIKPPPKAGCKGYIWKLRTCVYGLVDASRIWYFRVKEELLNLGMRISTYDPALFFWHCNEHFQGVLAVHVDDFLFGGTELFNSSWPGAQNIKLLCYSQSKNRLHRNPLYFVTSIVGAGNR